VPIAGEAAQVVRGEVVLYANQSSLVPEHILAKRLVIRLIATAALLRSSRNADHVSYRFQPTRKKCAIIVIAAA